MESQEPQESGTPEQVYPYSPPGSSSCTTEISDHDTDSSGDEGPQTSVQVGRMIDRAFNSDVVEFPTEEADILHVTDYDEDSDELSGSEMSSIYEELGFPRNPSHVVERARYVGPSSDDSDTKMSDGSFVPTDDEYEEYESGEEEEEEEANNGTLPIRESGGGESGAVRHEAAGLAITDTANQGNNAVAVKESFAKLQENSFSSDTLLLDQSCERAQWRILELEEIKRTVERELAEAIYEQESLQKQRVAKYQGFRRKTESAGISEELWDEYQAFCESLEPESGSTDGFSITCDEKHSGSYVKYDPEFLLFKEYAELPWNTYNFRCEASETHVVEFWPVLYPGADIEDASTWGNLYPALYDLAAKAARDGSEAAIDMLVALPDQKASFKGGWLFEYSTANPLTCDEFSFSVSDAGFTWTQNPVRSRRWTYRGAHKVDGPEDAGVKRERIQLMLKAAA